MSAPDWWVTALTQTVYGIRRNTRGADGTTGKWDQPGIKAQILKLIAANTSPADVGKKLRWADRDGKHSLVIGHVHVESSDRRTLVLVRPEGGDLDTTVPIDGNRKVSVSKP